ncbi:MAG: GNAT family N-acetyltransferase [Bacilli bacterium]|nr:GNAT family N-acetyltransferase [Bacilli bacterium]
MDIKFKVATIDDVYDIVDLTNECFFEKTDKEYARKVFEQTKDDKNQIYVIGRLNDKIIAHTKITIIPTMFEGMETYAILNHVCVKEEYRRHKIATHLLDEISKICKEKGCISIKLWSGNFRKAAHACYKDYGFEPFECGFFQKQL